MKKKCNEYYLKTELYDLIKTDSSLFDFIQQGSLDGMWYWNLEKIEDEWLSPKFWEVLGYDPKDKKHSSSEWQDIIFKDDLKQVTENFEKHLQDLNHPFDQIVRYIHKNGSTVLIRCRGIAIRDASGKAIRMLGAHTNITDLKQKEAALIESEQRFKILHNASFGGIAVHDKGIILECNQGLSDITGYSIAELVGMDGLLLIAPDYRDFVMDKIVTGYEKPYEAVGVRKNKESYPLKLEARNIPYQGKQVRVVEFRDVTEIKQKENLLVESEKKFRKLFEKAPFGYQSLDATGHFLEVNEKWLEIVGYQKEEVIGKWFGDFLVPEMKEPFKKRFEMFKQKGSVHSEFSMLTKEGNVILVGFDGNISYDENHAFIQTHCTVTDITEIDIANTKLKQSEEQYRLLTTLMPLGMNIREMIYDKTGNPVDYRFLTVNASYESMTGLKKEDIIGKTAKEILPNIEQYWIEEYAKVVQNGETIQFEEYSQALGKYFKVIAYPLPKNTFAVIAEDVTERILSENQRAKEHKDLLKSQEIAKLGTWRLDVKTNELTMSEELYKMHGFDPRQPIPPYTEHMKLFTKQSWDELSNALALTSTKGIPYELELEMVIKDGTKGWMWVKGEAEYDDQGQIASVTGAAQDITKRKQLEENLKEAHQIAKLGRWELIHNEHRLIWSETIFDIFEIDSKRFESSYESFLNVIHPDDRSTVDEAFKRSLVNKQAYSIEHRLLMDDGRVKWVSEQCNTEFDKEGQPIRSIGVVQDITDKKIKEEENIYIANHDYLTNLYNRHYFVNAFNKFVSQDCCSLALMLIDINGLKIINDTLGHVQGDEAIKQVAKLLMEVFDQDDVVARIGGDEFAILAHCKSSLQMQERKDKLMLRSNDISIENIPVSLAIGYEILADSDKNLDNLLSKVENYLFRHKITIGESVRNHAIKAILNTLTANHEAERIHSERVSQVCKQIGTKLGLKKEELDMLEFAGMFHDIGKISIPDAILNKPGKLTDEEYDIIKTHTQIGYQILRAADQYSSLAEYALSHHERWDGKGYPKGLKGKDIPLFSRIINVADSFEAMTSDRPYRKGMSVEEAIVEITRCSGSQFDPEIVDIFLLKALIHEQ